MFSCWKGVRVRRLLVRMGKWFRLSSDNWRARDQHQQVAGAEHTEVLLVMKWPCLWCIFFIFAVFSVKSLFYFQPTFDTSSAAVVASSLLAVRSDQNRGHSLMTWLGRGGDILNTNIVTFSWIREDAGVCQVFTAWMKEKLSFMCHVLHVWSLHSDCFISCGHGQNFNIRNFPANYNHIRQAAGPAGPKTKQLAFHIFKGVSALGRAAGAGGTCSKYLKYLTKLCFVLILIIWQVAKTYKNWL